MKPIDLQLHRILWDESRHFSFSSHVAKKWGQRWKYWLYHHNQTYRMDIDQTWFPVMWLRNEVKDQKCDSYKLIHFRIKYKRVPIYLKMNRRWPSVPLGSVLRFRPMSRCGRYMGRCGPHGAQHGALWAPHVEISSLFDDRHSRSVLFFDSGIWWKMRSTSINMELLDLKFVHSLVHHGRWCGR